jgi:hypothetical protein
LEVVGLEVGFELGFAVGAVVGVEVEDAMPVGAAVGAGVAAEVAEPVDRSAEREVFSAAVGREFFCAAVGLTVPAEWPVPGEASGAVAGGVVGCVGVRGTNGALRLGPPSTVLISRAT